MASSRTLLCVCSVLLLLLMADVAVAQADLPQQQALITGSRKHLRGDMSFSAEVEAANESMESFASRELADYTSKSNCSGNCKK